VDLCLTEFGLIRAYLVGYRHGANTTSSRQCDWWRIFKVTCSVLEEVTKIYLLEIYAGHVTAA